MEFGRDMKGVIFDIDGVLLDSMGIWKDLGARYLTKNGIKPEKNLGEILFSMSMEQGAAYLQKRYLPGRRDKDIADDLKGMLRDFYYEEVKAKEGAAGLLAKLKAHGIKMTAATSSPRTHVEKALERNGLLCYMERIFTSAEIGSSKHSPEIYNVAVGYMGLKREEVCVFEDSLYALKTAADAGYHTVGVCDEQGEPDQKGLKATAEKYISKLTEFTGI